PEVQRLLPEFGVDCGNVLAGDPCFEPAAAPAQRGEHDARAAELRPRLFAEITLAGTPDGEERMAVALDLRENAGIVPATAVGEEREADAPRPAALRGRKRDCGSRRVVSVRMRTPADQPDRSEQGQRELPAAADELVLHHV